MANILVFCRNVLQSTYNTAATVTTFNYRIVSSLIQGTGECYQATATVLRGLGSAFKDIIYYIFDFFVEALNVATVCLRYLGKFLVLVYHILSSVISGMLVGVEVVATGISQGITWLGAGIYTLSTHLAKTWETLGPDISRRSAEVSNSLTTMGGYIMDSSSSAMVSVLTKCVTALNYAGEKLNELGVYVADNTYVGCVRLCTYLKACMSDSMRGIWSYLSSFLEACLTPFCFTLKQIKDTTSLFLEWLGPSLHKIPTAVYIYILVTTLIIILFKIVMGHMTRRGVSIPLLNFSASRPARRMRNRQRLLIDSSDEESMYDDDTIEEYADQEAEDSDDDMIVDEVTESHVDDDDVLSSDTEEDDDEDGADDDSRDSDDPSSDGDQEVMEFEIATDSDSEAESEAPIQIELPDREDRYNLRHRFSPMPTGYDPNKLTPGELERLLENERDKRVCVVCQSHPKNVLVLPCRHMCLCVDCAHQIANQRTRTRRVCPLCRGRIETVMNVFL